MTQERKRTYRKKQSDNIAAAATEMGNIPPHAIDIEEAVLGAMMVNTDSVDQVMDVLKPVLSDLKDSGSIEQDADIVVFLHRPGLLGLAEDPEEQAKTEVIFAKNRNGQVGSVNMRYVGQLMKFEDENISFYESAMNSNPASPSGAKGRSQAAYQTPAMQQSYNPFDEFIQNDFIQ